MPAKRILVLAGTAEARDLAATLLAEGYEVISSLAGATRAPELPPGQVRIGGFGGVQGLIDFLKSDEIAAIADATHPFAAQMSRQAHEAAAVAGSYYCRLERSPWQPQTGDHWLEVPNAAAAAVLLPSGARALLTVGRKEISAFLLRPDVSGIIRMIEPPNIAVPARWRLVLSRPPFSLDAELRLMEEGQISHLVTKNSGGSKTAAKLDAARQRGVPVVMIARPMKPQAPSFPTSTGLALALRQLHHP